MATPDTKPYKPKRAGLLSRSAVALSLASSGAPPVQNEPEEGLGQTPRSVGEEIQFARELDAQKHQAVREFLPEQDAQSAALTLSPDEDLVHQQTVQRQRQATEQQEEEADDEDAETDEYENAVAMDAQRAATQQQSVLQQVANAKSAAKEAQAMIKNTRTFIRMTGEGIQLALSETILPLITLIAQLDLQILYKHFFKGSLGKLGEFFEPSPAEEAAGIGCTCGLPACCSCVLVLAIALLIAVIFEFVPGLETLFNIFVKVKEIF